MILWSRSVPLDGLQDSTLRALAEWKPETELAIDVRHDELDEKIKEVEELIPGWRATGERIAAIADKNKKELEAKTKDIHKIDKVLQLLQPLQDVRHKVILTEEVRNNSIDIIDQFIASLRELTSVESETSRRAAAPIKQPPKNPPPTIYHL